MINISKYNAKKYGDALIFLVLFATALLFPAPEGNHLFPSLWGLTITLTLVFPTLKFFMGVDVFYAAFDGFLVAFWMSFMVPASLLVKDAFATNDIFGAMLCTLIVVTSLFGAITFWHIGVNESKLADR
jgi:hypothetical protein